MLECQKRQACLRWAAEKCDSFRSIFLFCPPREPSRSTQTRKSPRSTKLAIICWASWVSPASERQGLVNMKVWMKRPHTQDTRTACHSSCAVLCKSDVEASENEQYLGTAVCGPIWIYQGIPIGFPHWTSNNGAVSFLIGFPKPVADAGRGTECRYKGGVRGLGAFTVWFQEWGTTHPCHGMRVSNSRGSRVAEDSTGGNKDAGLAQGPALLSILNLILLHTMGARRQRQGGEGLTCLSKVGWEEWHHHTDRWPSLGKSVGS